MVAVGRDIDTGSVATGGPVGVLFTRKAAADQGVLVLGVLRVARDATARVGGVTGRYHCRSRRVAVRAGEERRGREGLRI